jgi:hypothetical protein
MASNPTSEPYLNPTNNLPGEQTDSVELKAPVSPPGDDGHAAALKPKTASETTSTAVDSEENGPVKVIEDVEAGQMSEKPAAEAPVVAGPGPPPDGGWESWKCVVGSFFMHFIVIGSVYTWGGLVCWS